MGALKDPGWLDNGWGYRVTSRDELMRAVTRIGTFKPGHRYAWRGVPNSQYRVQSSLIRKLGTEGRKKFELPREDQVQRKEQFLLKEARKWGLGLEVPRPTDFHMLAFMQHHGVPTRLLDVTSNPMTALWFACRPPTSGQPDRSGVLMAFDITEYAECGSYTYPDERAAAEFIRGQTLHSALEESAEHHTPFTLRPTFKDSRMQAQEGFFISGSVPENETSTIRGVDGIPFPTAAPPGDALAKLFEPIAQKWVPDIAFVALVVPTSVKRSMREHLEGTFNRSWRVLFPDIEGFRDAEAAGVLAATTPDQRPHNISFPSHK